MNDTELDAILKTWEPPPPSAALRERVRQCISAPPRKRSYRWVLVAAGVAVVALVGVATMGQGQARLADGTYVQSSMQIEPDAAQERWHQIGFDSATTGNLRQGYWYDRATHTYTGYDLTVQPMGKGEYLMTVRPLSKPFRLLNNVRDAAQYREVPLPSLPAAQVVREGEAFNIDLARDAQTGDRVFERVELSPNSFHNWVKGFVRTVHHRHGRFAAWMQSIFAGEGHP